MPVYEILILWPHARKLDFVELEQQTCRPTCAAAQSDQHLRYLLIGKYNIYYKLPTVESSIF